MGIRYCRPAGGLNRRVGGACQRVHPCTKDILTFQDSLVCCHQMCSFDGNLVKCDRTCQNETLIGKNKHIRVLLHIRIEHIPSRTMTPLCHQHSSYFQRYDTLNSDNAKRSIARRTALKYSLYLRCPTVDP